MLAWPARSTTSSSAGSTAIPPARGGWSSIRELVEELFAGEEAWIVGGAVRDELLGRPLVDLDIAVHEPETAARAFARRSSGAPFPLSETHGAWRVALEGGRTVDFTPLRGGIEDDLASRDFTINAMARPIGGIELVDPFGGHADLESGAIRAVRESVFEDDPLRLLRAVRFEHDIEDVRERRPEVFRVEPTTEALIREHAPRVVEPAGERLLGELLRLSEEGFRRLDDLGLLAPLGGSIDRYPEASHLESPEYGLAVFFGENVERFPISNELKRFARTLLSADRPADDSPRAIHRFRRATEPWALEALAFLGARELEGAVLEARASEPKKPLVRGGELGIPPGPEVGRLLDEIAEERAAGTITTKEEALEYARRNAGSLRGDG
jgi:tRNA nucleotidyltransferase/poly(A) polymerase